MNNDLSDFVDESATPPLISLKNALKLTAIILQTIFVAPLLLGIPLLLSYKLFGIAANNNGWKAYLCFAIVIVFYWIIARQIELWKLKKTPEKSAEALENRNACRTELADMTAASLLLVFLLSSAPKYLPQFKSIYLISALYQYLTICIYLSVTIFMILTSTWVLFVYESQAKGAIAPRIIRLLSRILIHIGLLPLFPYLFRLFIV